MLLLPFVCIDDETGHEGHLLRCAVLQCSLAALAQNLLCDQGYLSQNFPNERSMDITHTICEQSG